MIQKNLLPFLVVAGLISNLPAGAQETLGTLEMSGSQQLAYPLGSADPVVELTYVDGFIDSDDRIRTTVLVEGTSEQPVYVVEIYRPPYMKEAGLFRSEISEEEFRRLMRSFGSEEVLSSSPEAFDEAINAQVTSSPTLDTSIVGTHGARVQIDLRIANESIGLPTPDIRSLSVPSQSLQAVARIEQKAPRDVASGVLALEGLIRSKKLERIE